MPDHSRASYLERRYRGSQSLLNSREHAFVTGMLARLQPAPRQVLDIPCGPGRFTPLLRAAATERLVCADISRDRLQHLLDAEPETGTPLETLEVDLYQPLDLADAAFDLVFNFRFFHHVSDDALRQHVISELVRVSRQYLIVSYYDHASLHAFQKRVWKRRGHARSVPMVPRKTFLGWFESRDCRVLEDRGVLPGIHAHRVALLERAGPGGDT